MTSLYKGSGTTSKTIEELAEKLCQELPPEVQLLTGITLADPKRGRSAVVDLIAVAKTTVIVGVDTHREDGYEIRPRTAEQLIQQVQQETGKEPLVVQARWLAGDALQGYPEGYSDAAAIKAAIMQAGSQDDTPGSSERGQALIELLKREDASSANPSAKEGEPETTKLTINPANPSAKKVEPETVKLTMMARQTATSQAPTAAPPVSTRQGEGSFRGVGGIPSQLENALRRFIAWILRGNPADIRPSQVTEDLKKAMMAPENYIEDVDYEKIVPNVYVVELNKNLYERKYQRIENRLCKQWQKKLTEHLFTKNNRGRTEYYCVGPIEVRIKPVTDLAESQVYIQCNIVEGENSSQSPSACLELRPSGKQWHLDEGLMTIGRDGDCDIYLDSPLVQEALLVSSKHAYIQSQAQTFRLFDGSPKGRLSSNGTFVNGQQIYQKGHQLQDGDIIILAALDQNNPRPDTPGVVELVFRLLST